MSWAERYIGLPYEDGARGPQAFDCWGLVRDVLARELDILLPEYPYGDTKRERNEVLAAATVEQSGRFYRVDGPQEFAVVICHQGNRRPHVGVCTDDQRMLHAMQQVGACLVRLDSPAWVNAVTGFYLPHRRAS